MTPPLPALRRRHVFICFNALSFDAAIRIAHRVLADEPQAEQWFLLMFKADVSLIPTTAQVRSTPRPMERYTRWEKPFAVAQWFAQVHAELTADAAPLHVYTAHPVELPGNHYLFRQRPGDRVDLLPDGLVNYVEVSMRPERLAGWPRYGVRVALELLAARRHGLRYRPVVAGHQTQYQTGLYHTAWTYNPQGLVTRAQKVVTLPASPHDASSCEVHDSGLPAACSARRSTLFLDQELHSLVTPALEREVRQAALAELALRGGAVLYKAHPRGKNRAAALREHGLQVTDVTGPSPAEHLVARGGVETVVSFFSTTLLLLPPGLVTRRVAVLPSPDRREVLRPELLRQSLCAFEAAGVEWLRAEGPRTGER